MAKRSQSRRSSKKVTVQPVDHLAEAASLVTAAHQTLSASDLADHNLVKRCRKLADDLSRHNERAAEKAKRAAEKAVRNAARLAKAQERLTKLQAEIEKLTAS